jgi:hypothetical protein
MVSRVSPFFAGQGGGSANHIGHLAAARRKVSSPESKFFIGLRICAW